MWKEIGNYFPPLAILIALGAAYDGLADRLDRMEAGLSQTREAVARLEGAFTTLAGLRLSPAPPTVETEPGAAAQ